MTQDILQTSRASAALLADICALPAPELTQERVLPLLRQALEVKLGLSPTGEERLRNLVVQSIRQKDLAQQALSPAQIRRAIEKYDCHQTSLVAKKTVLLFFFLEEKLGIHLEDAQVAQIKTIPQLVQAVLPLLKAEKEGGGS